MYRTATAKLAARRFGSHSQGVGSVSSKSLMSKMSCRFGCRERAEIHQVKSAQACTRIAQEKGGTKTRGRLDYLRPGDI
jgi:hypothetical protein